MENCPCGNALPYEECCAPFHQGEKTPETAEALMRSRYSAFVQLLPDYLIETHDPQTRGEINRDDIEEWARESQWEGLEILDTHKGGPGDKQGVVEFKAHYSVQGHQYVHHERSDFTFKDGKWYYTSGEVFQETITRSTPKVGRNDPCPCGSGKKYKKCCLI